MKQSRWNLWFLLSIFWFMIHFAFYCYPDVPMDYWPLHAGAIICIINLIGCIIIGCQPAED